MPHGVALMRGRPLAAARGGGLLKARPGPVKKTMTKKWLLRAVVAAGIILALALAAAYSLAPVAVQVGRATRGEAVQAVYATGTVEASITERIAPQLSGRLVELRADEGDSVHKGEVLARLDASDLQASLAELQARAAYASTQYQRLQPLAGKGYVSADQLQQARSNLDAANADVRRGQQQLRFMTLLAPANAHVIRRDGEVGDVIPANQAVFYLARDQVPPRIDTDVDEEDIPKVRVGQQVLIHADAFAGQVFSGRVSEITPKGDPVARSYRVRVSLPADTPLLIGMTAETNIVIAHRSHALLVPSTALNGDTLWLLRNGRAQPQKVQTGAKGTERTEIISGIGPDDQILLQPPNDLHPGQRLRALPAGAPP